MARSNRFSGFTAASRYYQPDKKDFIKLLAPDSIATNVYFFRRTYYPLLARASPMRYGVNRVGQMTYIMANYGTWQGEKFVHKSNAQSRPIAVQGCGFHKQLFIIAACLFAGRMPLVIMDNR